MTSKPIYCTYVTFYSGNKLPPFYVGSSDLTRIQNGYRGSVGSIEYSKVFKSELKQNPHLFKIKIISTHSTRPEAYIRENQIQKKLNVVNSPLYMNKAVVLSPHFSVGPMATETKSKISNTTLGRPKTPEHAKNISKGKRGISTRGHGFKDSPESNLLRSKAMTGREQPKHTCPYCQQVGGNAMTRWHFDNCKHKSTVILSV